MTTPNGVPVTVCAICGRPSAFINDNGRCLAPACREAKK